MENGDDLLKRKIGSGRMADGDVIAFPFLDRQGDANNIGLHFLGGSRFGIEGDHLGR